MDKLRPLGRGIDDLLLPTFAAYAPLVLAKETEIKSTRRETYKYGATSRQQLDVYYPNQGKAAPQFRAKPVFIFLYGGGFVGGSKINEEYAHGLVFKNVGHFFASRYGFTVIVPDYRLISHGAKYPSGGEDVKLVIDWIAKELTKQEGYESTDLFLLGNSAGGIHVTTYLLDPEFKESRESVVSEERKGPGVLLRGVILLGVPFHWGGDDNAILRAYLGEGKIRENSSLGILEKEKKKDAEPVLPGVKISILVSELDPELMYESAQQFKKEWTKADIDYDILDGHNHISPQLGLSTGVEKEEAWGVQVAEFCQSRATK
ncbi:putative alpha beta-hydrolase protein [Daldinia childiae]|uniref:putative alpha beta-hydrolase protein n=1 Tax=Daldinia childiae TaxID=326645 RepID=UPI0014456FA5|nr:putative alpha beta-hydrolase protein [Daldinia childiae]KAF3067273.1 putative alpha beta-hydrolase protein [Daldinia childiae]